MPAIRSAYRPAWWLRNAHAQTLWPAVMRRRNAPTVRWERLELDDGDFLDLAWHGPRDAPVVLFLHGLEGSLESHYAGGIMQALASAGLQTCMMHFRNCGREPNRLPISYHSGKTDDPQRVLEHIAATCGSPPTGAVGISLGGNVLLKWLGEQGEHSALRRAVAVSVPFRLEQAARRLEDGGSRLYKRHLLRAMRASYRRKFARMPSPLNVDIDRLDTFFAFDDAVTAALHGFDGVDDYYARCSSRQFLPSIRVPTLILHASDDPFMYPETAPDVSELPDQVTLELTPRGGHIGFVDGSTPWRAGYYAERRIAEWLSGDGAIADRV
jgi:predicted alpha/beta-fold hydrolase